MGKRANFRLSTLAGLAVAALVSAHGAAAASVSDTICTAHAAEGWADGYPEDGELTAAADRIEAALARSRSGLADPDSAFALLSERLQGGAAPSPVAVARYCAAAGEVMRLARQGSQNQAQNYLMTALREARVANDQFVTARAAYRLGLVSLLGQQASGVRGSGRRTRGSAAAAEGAKDAESAANDACSGLTASDAAAQPPSFITALALKCASERALQAGDAPLSALASLRLARFHLSLSRGGGAQAEALRGAALDEAIAAMPVAEGIEDAKNRVELLGRLVATALELGEAKHHSLARALAAMAEGEAGDSSGSSFVAGLRAKIALAAGDRERGRSLAEQAILLESQRPLPVRLPEWYLTLAAADPADRDRHVFAAYTALENIRPLLPRFDPLTEEPTFGLFMRNVFEQAVDVQLASANGGGEAPRIADAQRMVEAYRQAELQSVFGSECLPPREPVRPEELTAGEVLLYPILLADRVELLYASGSDAVGRRSYKRLAPNRSADRTRVSRLVEEMVLSIGYGEDDRWRKPAQELYGILIKPVEGELRSGAMLAIIPDGALRALPFAALISADGKYLVQKTRLSVAPALAYSQPGEHGGEETLSVVAASLQREVNLPAGYFPRLEGTAEEAKIAANVADTGQLIPDFRKQDLVKAMSGKRVNVLHLATHASFNGRSDRAFIVANGEVILLSELREIVGRNRARGENLDLLVLSACETAVGDDQASMGLAGAAVQAGALSAIASLWQVNDTGTAELMKQFYSRYSRRQSRSGALREAQLAMIESGGGNADPGVWAAFTLLGAWR
jgi:CHAT domain-containing protein